MSVCQEGKVYQILLCHHEMWTAIFAPAWGNIGAAWVTCVDYEGEARKDSRNIKWQANSRILVPNIIQVIKNVHHKKKKTLLRGIIKIKHGHPRTFCKSNMMLLIFTHSCVILMFCPRCLDLNLGLGLFGDHANHTEFMTPCWKINFHVHTTWL